MRQDEGCCLEFSRGMSTHHRSILFHSVSQCFTLSIRPPPSQELLTLRQRLARAQALADRWWTEVTSVAMWQGMTSSNPAPRITLTWGSSRRISSWSDICSTAWPHGFDLVQQIAAASFNRTARIRSGSGGSCCQPLVFWPPQAPAWAIFVAPRYPWYSLVLLWLFPAVVARSTMFQRHSPFKRRLWHHSFPSWSEKLRGLPMRACGFCVFLQLHAGLFPQDRCRGL